MKLKFLFFTKWADANGFHKASAIPERFYQPDDAANSRENYFGVRYTECQDRGIRLLRESGEKLANP